MRVRFRYGLILLSLAYLGWGAAPAAPQALPVQHFDVVIVGGTPGGIMAAVAVARNGHSVVLLERTDHLGGLPANGLGATDIATRGATGGLFLEFVGRVRQHYVATYGADSTQVKACSDGYHFEPHVAAKVFAAMLAEHQAKITICKRRQFDAEPGHVTLTNGAVTEIVVTDRDRGQPERYAGKVFIDATYEGDLAAAAGAEYRLGREARTELGEPFAGRLYMAWHGKVGSGSTGLGDNAIQAYNYRLCLTNRPENRLPIPRPANYRREEYASFAEDVRLGRSTGNTRHYPDWDGLGRVASCVALPNAKCDANNQHLMFLSTDLPEENWPWPTADWAWRDRFAVRLRDYTLGLLWFAQNDEAVPVAMRERIRQWGLARDEYADNGHFPRQVYVREGRRVVGTHLFTAHDALPVKPGQRPPVHMASITASHYSLDSHAVRKREPDRLHLDGFFAAPTRPYTVPLGVMIPRKVNGLLTPVPVSATHIGFSTLRMEPCWMALGQAAGEAASLSIEMKVPVRDVALPTLQRRLLRHQAVLIYFSDCKPGDAHYEALQFFAVRGFLPPNAWKARLGDVVIDKHMKQWCQWAGVPLPTGYAAGQTKRGEMLSLLLQAVEKLDPVAMQRIQGKAMAE